MVEMPAPASALAIGAGAEAADADAGDGDEEEAGAAGMGADVATMVFLWPFGANVPKLQVSECGVKLTTLPLTEETKLAIDGCGTGTAKSVVGRGGEQEGTAGVLNVDDEAGCGVVDRIRDIDVSWPQSSVTNPLPKESSMPLEPT